MRYGVLWRLDISNKFPAAYAYNTLLVNGNAIAILCRVKSYPSTDFTNWQLEDFYQPANTSTTVTKPVVRYSNATGMSVISMHRASLAENIYCAVSKSPGQPWSQSPSVMQGTAITHDFDVAVGSNGDDYMVPDVQNNKYTSDHVRNGIFGCTSWHRT